MLSQLLQSFEAVPHFALADIFNIRNGYTPAKTEKSYWQGGDVPWFRLEDFRTNGTVLSQARQNIPTEAVKGGKLFPADSILVATSATVGIHALVTVPHLSNQRFACLSLKTEFKDKFDIKFLYYFCFILDRWCLENTQTSSFASVDMAGFRKFKFPMPALSLQAEIVRVLDTFTELDDLLEREEKMRRAQYRFFAEELFKNVFVGQSSTRALCDLASFKSGFSIKSEFYSESGTRVIRISDVQNGYLSSKDLKFISQKNAESLQEFLLHSGDLVLSMSGSVGRVAQIEANALPAVLNQRVVKVTPNTDLLLPRYLFHFLNRDSFEMEAQASAGSGSVKNLSMNWLNQIPIPAPELSVQNKISEILDMLHEIIFSPEAGILAERSARKLQYEYYRNQLLNFEEA